MPTTSIDTFFACSLIVSVAIAATVFAAGNLQTQIDATRDVNDQDYLKNLADRIVFSSGNPPDWGSQGIVPQSFGLSDPEIQRFLGLDIDKVSRLNNENVYALSYPEIMKASRLGCSFGISVFQILSISIEPVGNETLGDFTSYSFVVRTSKDTRPAASNLRYYVIAPDFMENATVTTSNQGIANISFQIPISSKGPALLIVFARASIDSRMTTAEVYSFGHQEDSQQPNQTILKLSPLNYSLKFTSDSQEITVNSALAFTFSYQSNLTATSHSTFSIPSLIDTSPILIVVQGLNHTSSFVEWVAYPQLPSEAGADFSNSEANVFDYIVTIKGTFYKLQLSLGDPTP